MEQKILDDPDRIGHRCRLITIRFDWSRRPAAVLLNGKEVSEAIRTPEVTAVTYQAADNPWVREELVKQQRAIGEGCGSMVTEGRDQGTIVFPHADFKFYLNAHPEERARRRVDQLAKKGISAELSDILEQIVQRDMQFHGLLFEFLGLLAKFLGLTFELLGLRLKFFVLLNNFLLALGEFGVGGFEFAVGFQEKLALEIEAVKGIGGDVDGNDWKPDVNDLQAPANDALAQVKIDRGAQDDRLVKHERGAGHGQEVEGNAVA